MNDLSAISPRNRSRRRFIAAGAVSAAALSCGAALAWSWPVRGARAPMLAGDVDAIGIVGAMTPVLLGDALRGAIDTAAARDEVVRDALAAMDGLAPPVRSELAQLFAVLAFAPTRILLTGLVAPWQSATPQAIDAAIGSLRDSRLETKRAAYDALHALVLGAWYGNPRAWPAIGYPGPPGLD